MKIQKLLVTAGVYEPVKENTSYGMIQRLYADGKTVNEIMKLTGLSKAIINASIPYERFPHNVDEMGVDISGNIIRKRRQRNHAEMKKENAMGLLMNNITDDGFWAALSEHQGDVFITSAGERYSYKLEKNEFVVGKSRFSRKAILSVLHNALELKSRNVKETDPVREMDFVRTPVLSHVYPILVCLHILSGNIKEFSPKRAETRITTCSCCGRKTENLYPVRCYSDLVDIAEAEEKAERSLWSEEKLQEVSRLEADMGRRPDQWNKLRAIRNSAIIAYDEMLREEGPHHLCSLCASTIRMALEEDENPKTESDADYASIPAETLRKIFKESVEEIPSCRFIDQRGNIISPYDFSTESGDGEKYLYKAIDSRGIVHYFMLSVRLMDHEDGDYGLFFMATELHKLTKAGRIAAGNTITDYEITHSRMLYKGEDRNNNILIGFMELEDKIRHRLQNLTLKISDSKYTNSVRKGRNWYLIDSPGEFKVVSMHGRYMSVADDWDGGDYGYMIDGIVFSGQELALMLSSYEEMPIVFQEEIRDFRTGECLVPVVLTQNALVDETIELINMFTSNGGFEREKDRENFAKLFDKEVLTKLKMYHDSRPLGYGRLAGMEIIRRLKWITETEEFQDHVREILR